MSGYLNQNPTLFEPNFFSPDNQDPSFSGYGDNLCVIFVYACGKPCRPGKPGRPGKSGMHGRPGRPVKPGRPEKPGKFSGLASLEGLANPVSKWRQPLTHDI